MIIEVMIIEVMIIEVMMIEVMMIEVMMIEVMMIEVMMMMTLMMLMAFMISDDDCDDNHDSRYGSNKDSIILTCFIIRRLLFICQPYLKMLIK